MYCEINEIEKKDGNCSFKIYLYKPFWKTVKPLLSDKGANTTNISLVDRVKTLTEDKDLEPVF